jgi:hypothetical protein
LEARVPRTITVAQSGQGDVRTIGEAVSRAGPGDTVRILDDAVYAEAVRLDDPDRLASVTLEAVARATVAAPATAAAAVAVKNTPGVVVRGLRITTQRNQHAVTVAGPTGALLDDLVIDQPEDAEWAGAVIAWGAGPALGQPVRVRNSTFRTAKLGVVIGGNGGAVSGVEVDGNRFLRGSFQVVVCQAADDVAVRGNVFCRGVALSIDLPATSRGLRVGNNTFWLTPKWLSVLNPNLPGEVEVYNNLILGADDVEAAGVEAGDLPRHWSFHHNRWEPGPRTNRERAGAVAEVEGRIDLLNRDPEAPSFLRPPAGSPLGAQGAGGELPKYVGALPPADR